MKGIKHGLFWIFCTFAIVIITKSSSVSAALSGTCGDNLKWVLDNSGVLTVSGVGDMQDFDFPDKDSIKNIVIEDGVTSISEHAFSFCDNLTSIVIPNSVTKIDRCAFYSCEKLASIEMSENVINVGISAFNDTAYYNNKNNWYEGACYIDDILIGVEKDIKGRVIIKNGTRLIASRAFYESWNLRAVTIPKSVLYICDEAFYNVGIRVAYYDGTEAEWENVKIGSDNNTLTTYIKNKDNVTVNSGSIGSNIDWTLNMSTGEMNINGSGELTSCGWETYKYNIETVNIIGNITKIGKSVFYYHHNLRSVIIPDSVTSIEYEAFANCGSLKSIIISGKLISIGEDAFYNTAYYADENNWDHGVLYLDNYLIAAKSTIYGVCNIKENTRILADGSFKNCSGLTDVTMPKNVVHIGVDAFRGCENLISVKLSDNITEISKGTFLGCKALSSIIIPDSVKSIGNDAFYNCAGLKSITFGKRTSSIGVRAFSNCESIESLTLPNSVTLIGESAFTNCKSLKNAVISNNVQKIEKETFFGCNSLEEITLPFIGHKKKNSLTYEYDSYDAVFGYIFGYYTSHTYEYDINQYTKNGSFYWYHIPQSLRKVTVTSEDVIPVYAFKGCNMLTDIVFFGRCYNGMYYSAFEGCTNLKNVVLPFGIRSISESAFRDCKSLSNIRIPYSVTTIGESAFYNCSDLTSLELPEKVFMIYGYAFAKCINLNSITIPKTVKEIRSDAFRECNELKNIYYTGSMSEWENINIWSNNDALSKATIHYDAKYSLSEITQKLSIKEFVILNAGENLQVVGTYSSDSPSFCTDAEGIEWRSSDDSVVTAGTSTPLFDSTGYRANVYLNIQTHKPGCALLTAYSDGKELAKVNVIIPEVFAFDSDWYEVDKGTKAELKGRIKLSGGSSALQDYIKQNLSCRALKLNSLNYVSSDVTISDYTVINENEAEFTVTVSRCETSRFNVRAEIGENLSATTEMSFKEKSPYFTVVDKDGWHSTENVNSFAHNPYDFGLTKSVRPYNTSERYWNILSQEELYDDILAFSNKNWGGACFGLSASIISFFEEILQPSDIGADGKTYWEFQYPSVNTDLRDVIMFYQLLSVSRKPTHITINPKSSFKYALVWAESAFDEQNMTNKGFWKQLYDECANNINTYNWNGLTVTPLLFGYKYYGEKDKVEGHQIIIYDYDYDSENQNMIFYFYDPNGQTFSSIYVNTNDYSFSFVDGNNHKVDENWLAMEYYSVDDTIAVCNAANTETSLFNMDKPKARFLIDYGKAFVLTNSNNEKLYFDGNVYSGNMEVMDFSYISSDNCFKNQFIVNFSESFIVECSDGTSDFTLDKGGEYYKIESTNSNKVTFRDNDVLIDGSNMQASVWTTDNTKQSQLLFMSLSSDESFSITKNDDKLDIKSNSPLTNVNLSWLDGADVTSETLPDDTTISISGEVSDSSVLFDLKNKCAEISSNKKYDNAYVYAACYKNNKLTELYSKTVDLKDKSTKVFFEDLDFDLYDMIKIFVWESQELIKPICKPCTVLLNPIDYDFRTGTVYIQSDINCNNANVVVAVYEENRLLDVEAVKTEIKKGSNEVILDDLINKNADEFKIFVWDGNMKPLFDAVTVNTEN